MSEEKKGEGRMSGTMGTGDILCPFFDAHGRRAIQCRDIYPGTSKITSSFVSPEERDFHEATYCKAEYKKCWLYDWAMRMMWEDEED